MPHRNAKPAGIAADAIEKGMLFGWWRVEDAEVIRKAPESGSENAPRQAYIMCHCTACGNTTRPVRRAFLLNGRSTSCCLRGPAKAKAAAELAAKE